MKRSLSTLLATVYTLAVILLGGVPFVASADLTSITASGFVQNAYSVWYHDFTSSTFLFTVDTTDYTVLGARFARVYACSIAGCGSFQNGTLSPLGSDLHSTSTVDYSAGIQPTIYGYTAVVLYNAGQGYITEYPINDDLFSGSGNVYGIWSLSSETVATSTVEQIELVGRLGFNAIIIFFISFVVTIWMFRLLMR